MTMNAIGDSEMLWVVRSARIRDQIYKPIAIRKALVLAGEGNVNNQHEVGHSNLAEITFISLSFHATVRCSYYTFPPSSQVKLFKRILIKNGARYV